MYKQTQDAGNAFNKLYYKTRVKTLIKLRAQQEKQNVEAVTSFYRQAYSRYLHFCSYTVFFL